MRCIVRDCLSGGAGSLLAREELVSVQNTSIRAWDYNGRVPLLGVRLCYDGDSDDQSMWCRDHCSFDSANRITVCLPGFRMTAYEPVLDLCSVIVILFICLLIVLDLYDDNDERN